jgi:Uma2 family endonuclease
MGDPAKRRATYQDVLDAPPHRVAEVIFGDLYTFPRPAIRHARSATELGGELTGPFGRGKGGPGGWVILAEPELHLGAEPDIVVPDLAGWRRERMPRVPREAAFISLAPDWICEVLSPSTQALDRSDKMDVYRREGVVNLWHLEPIGKTLEVFRLERERWVQIAVWRGDMGVRAEPFDAIEIELAALWAE